MDTYTKLLDRLSGVAFEETRSLEFKRGLEWNGLKHHIARAALAMSNLKGGGHIVVGIDEDKAGKARMVGMGKETSGTFDADKVSEFVNRYADPPIQVGLRNLVGGGRHFIVISVQEFNYEPVVCKRDFDRNDGKKYLETGRLYYRPRGRTESTPRLTSHDLRELLDLAVLKRYSDWRRNTAAMLPSAALHGVFDRGATSL